MKCEWCNGTGELEYVARSISEQEIRLLDKGTKKCWACGGSGVANIEKEKQMLDSFKDNSCQP